LRPLLNSEATLMSKLPKFTLEFDEKRDKWTLKNDRTNRVDKTFTTRHRPQRVVL
jgi:hypothetical protein